MDTKQDKCLECGKWIKSGREVMMELDTNTGKYYRDGIPANGLSQGWFQFGADCARKLNGQRARLLREI
jgi:hypothetical protein